MSGATFCFCSNGNLLPHFNPRSHVGSDHRHLTPSVLQSQFQSTLPCRERHYPLNSISLTVQISIHAPMSGATFGSSFFTNFSPNFNPRSHVGSDYKNIERQVKYIYFNPRSHVGSDNKTLYFIHYARDFNPRSHVGSDLMKMYFIAIIAKFQSTLPCRERLDLFHLLPFLNGFQSTLPCRERPALFKIKNNFKEISIHAPMSGATMIIYHLLIWYFNFNPRSHVGSDTNTI